MASANFNQTIRKLADISESYGDMSAADVAVVVASKFAAERSLNQRLRQKIANQRRQLRQLQALYNAYLIGCKGGREMKAKDVPGLPTFEELKFPAIRKEGEAA